jgi:uncharacterized membrane protein
VWRWTLSRGGTPDLTGVRTLVWISWVEFAMVLLLPFVAALMARGVHL